MSDGASPQVEDGFTSIANELLEAIIRFDFSKRQQKIVFAIIRKTYGFGKKSDDISLSQMHEMTGIAKGHCSLTVTELVTLRVLLKSQGKYGYLIELNKNYLDWGLLKQ
ncbi:MAG: replication protein [Thiotrichales bacterium]|nr:replication protein [Thiotrichales bacterium]